MKGTAETATHYQRGTQPIEEMQEILTYPEFEGFLKGNIIKYIRRAKFKGNEEEDLTKAKQYGYWLYLLHNNENINPNEHIYTGKETLANFYYWTLKGE